jgi:dCMP deaminase
LKQILLYLPVIHAGHEAFFRKHSDAHEVLILGEGFKAVSRNIAKDIRALPPERAAQYLQLTLPRARIRVIEPSDLPAAVTGDILVLPDEEITRSLSSEHRFSNVRDLIFDTTFLRWDREWSRVQRPAHFDGKVAVGELPCALLAQAERLSARSSDWWRRVGAIAVREHEVLGFAWNHHHPTEYSPYIDGDPRDGFSRGVRADLSTAIHAEASIIACAARDGISLRGADLYVLTFPCPTCARLIAEAGFRQCFFAGPYSALEGENVLRAAGVEIFWVDIEESSPDFEDTTVQVDLASVDVN